MWLKEGDVSLFKIRNVVKWMRQTKIANDVEWMEWREYFTDEIEILRKSKLLYFN